MPPGALLIDVKEPTERVERFFYAWKLPYCAQDTVRLHFV